MKRALLVLGAFAVYLSFMIMIEPRPQAIIDLGVARFPSGARDLSLAVHEWKGSAPNPRSVRRSYRVRYGHGGKAVAKLVRRHKRLAESFKYKVDGSLFYLYPPPQCQDREWSCIYSTLIKDSHEHLAPLVDRIGVGLRDESRTTSEAAAWLLDFVQRIPYQLPTNQPFGVLPPALVASDDWGDCDSKSLLLIHLLNEIGIDAILLSSVAHRHAVVGIRVPTSGEAFSHYGKKYAWAETTAENAPLGWIHPRLLAPDDWRAIPVYSDGKLPIRSGRAPRLN